MKTGLDPGNRKQRRRKRKNSKPSMDLRVGRKFRIGRKIGSGSFGGTLPWYNFISGEEVAIKLESIRSRHPQLDYESRVYKYLSGVSVSPSFAGSVVRVSITPWLSIYWDPRWRTFSTTVTGSSRLYCDYAGVTDDSVGFSTFNVSRRLSIETLNLITFLWVPEDAGAQYTLSILGCRRNIETSIRIDISPTGRTNL